MAEGSSKRITVTVKTPKDKKDLEVDENMTVEKVKWVGKIYPWQIDTLVNFYTLKKTWNHVSTHATALIVFLMTSKDDFSHKLPLNSQFL